MKILAGTKNKAKLKEIKYVLEKYGVEVLALPKKIKEPVEYGKTFKENAIIKAKHYYRKTKMPVVCDDGGIVIPYLNGQPGVKSRMWLGYRASDIELINYTLERMKNAAGKQRKAYLVCCIAYYDGKNLLLQEEKISGYISKKPDKKIMNGYPFRSIFVVNRYNKFYSSLSKKEHAEINHRIRALKKLAEKLIRLKLLYNFR